MSLPLMYGLAAQYPQAEIHVILKQEHRCAFRLLPGFERMKIWHFDKRDQPGPIALKRFCEKMRATMGEIDIFFALPPSFSSALMGWFLKAKERVGYSSQNRSFLLTHVYEKPQGVHRSNEYFTLLNRFLKRELNFPHWEPPVIDHNFIPPVPAYLVMNPNSNASSRRMPLTRWPELAGFFSNRDFVITGTEADRERVAQLIADLKRQVPRNRYHNLAGRTSVLDLIALFANSEGVLSNDSGPAHLAHLLGVPSLVFFGAGDPVNTGPYYGTGPALVMRQENLPCAPCLKNVCPLGTLDCLKALDFQLYQDQIRNLFPTKETESEIPLVAKAASL